MFENNKYALGVVERFSHPLGIAYAAFILLLLASYIMKKTVIDFLDAFLSKLLRIFCCCFYKSDHEVELARQESQKKLDRQGVDAYSQDFIADLKIAHLNTLYQRLCRQIVHLEDNENKPHKWGYQQDILSSFKKTLPMMRYNKGVIE